MYNAFRCGSSLSYSAKPITPASFDKIGLRGVFGFSVKFRKCNKSATFNNCELSAPGTPLVFPFPVAGYAG